MTKSEQVNQKNDKNVKTGTPERKSFESYLEDQWLGAIYLQRIEKIDEEDINGNIFVRIHAKRDKYTKSFGGIGYSWSFSFNFLNWIQRYVDTISAVSTAKEFYILGTIKEGLAENLKNWEYVNSTMEPEESSEVS